MGHNNYPGRVTRGTGTVLGGAALAGSLFGCSGKSVEVHSAGATVPAHPAATAPKTPGEQSPRVTSTPAISLSQLCRVDSPIVARTLELNPTTVRSECRIGGLPNLGGTVEWDFPRTRTIITLSKDGTGKANPAELEAGFEKLLANSNSGPSGFVLVQGRKISGQPVGIHDGPGGVMVLSPDGHSKLNELKVVDPNSGQNNARNDLQLAEGLFPNQDNIDMGPSA